MFKDTPESFPVTFVPGDAFDDAFLTPAPIALQPPTEPLPDFASLTTLTPLQGRLSVIHASSLFHLFNEEQQAELAQRLASLLSPTPGSIIFGAHSGNLEKGLRSEYLRANAVDAVTAFCHSVESWIELWEGVFGLGKVEVNAVLKEVTRPDVKHITDSGRKLHLLLWSVKRL